jgi:hypothetical protein
VTYKKYIGRQFSRTESSALLYTCDISRGKKLAKVCLSTRKDFRVPQFAARSRNWRVEGRVAFNRLGKFLYRNGRKCWKEERRFIEELSSSILSKAKAEKESEPGIDAVDLLCRMER